MPDLSSALRAAAEERGWEWRKVSEFAALTSRGLTVHVSANFKRDHLFWVGGRDIKGAEGYVPCPSPSDLPAALDRCWEEARKALGVGDE